MQLEKNNGRYLAGGLPYQYGNGVRLDGDRLILSNVGAVHVVLYRPLEETPKTLTLTRSRTGKWYVSCSCAVQAKPLPPTGDVVDIDVGLTSFATLSTGDAIAPPVLSA